MTMARPVRFINDFYLFFSSVIHARVAKLADVTLCARTHARTHTTGAGDKLLYMLERMDVRNTLVVVTRWYGGIQLGPDRFKHITGCAKQVAPTHATHTRHTRHTS
jgi:hypothetical protein